MQDANQESDEQRSRRLEALEALARENGASSGPAEAASSSTRSSGPIPPAAAPRRRIPRLALALSLLALVAVVAVLVDREFFQAPTRPTTASTPSVVTLALNRTHFSCPMAIGWSPDSRRIAVLADAGQCNLATNLGLNLPLAVLIYDASDGKLLTTFYLPVGDLDEWGVGGNGYAVPYAITWSPDGSTLALGYDNIPLATGTPTPRAQLSGASGVWLLSLADGHARPVPTARNPALGSALSGLDAPPITRADNTLPPALSYRWTPDGQIVVDQPLPPSPSPQAFTGSPVDHPYSASFPVWQAGAVVPLPAPQGSSAPAADFFTTAISRWSPDGQHVAVERAVQSFPLLPPSGPAATSTPDACDRHGLAPCATTPAACPDEALAQVMTRLNNYMNGIGQQRQRFAEKGAVPVAWSPNGSLLATIMPGDRFAPGEVFVHVSLLDTKTGAVVKDLKVESLSSQVFVFSSAALFWAPSGKQLGFIDTFENTVTLWGPGSLPASAG